MIQSQKTKYSLSQLDYSYELKALDDNLNLSEQENAVENNMLSTATGALNQEDSTVFTNIKVIYTHQVTNKKHSTKHTEHQNGEITPEKQYAVERMKFNYFKFCPVRGIHIVAFVAFVVAIPLAYYSLASLTMNLMINSLRSKLVQFNWNTTTQILQHI
ncbi:MAG: hypothetical protein EZS28_022605 [Streblomastix strix]|uniref:Uncharacterized protein n=1 Tax=Streblomastix strix TaxID=222440 RepID=A0A5J4VGX3_9EUKA|nr:MAG: hypothetical protein EZS28_022605 [Streblomastix strix]